MKNIKQNIGTGIVLVSAGLASLLNSGCSAEQWQAYKQQTEVRNVEALKEMFRKQFREAEMINLYYDGDKILYFNKKGFVNRYAVELTTLTAYDFKDDEWKYNELMTNVARSDNRIFAAVGTLKAQANAINMSKSRAERDADVIGDMNSRFGANMATTGLLKAIAEHAR